MKKRWGMAASKPYHVVIYGTLTKKCKSHETLIIICFTVLILLGIGFFFGKRITTVEHQGVDSEAKDDDLKPDEHSKGVLRSKKWTNEEWRSFSKLIDAKRLRLNLEFLSREPHPATGIRDKLLLKWIEESWNQYGLDHVERVEYDGLYSWPNKTNPNTVRIYDNRGNAILTSAYKETPLREEGNIVDLFLRFSKVLPAYSAYSQSATVKVALKNLLYVNYGTRSDFKWFKSNNISLLGKICIARYGKIFRGDKALNCERYGCVGLILYSDPAEVLSSISEEADNIYPNGHFMPETAISRGSLFVPFGDPSSPEWPSIGGAYRLTDDQIRGIPKIPVQPVRYSDAAKIMRYIGGSESPSEWHGTLENVEYRIGNTVSEDDRFTDWSIELAVHNYQEEGKATNVIGYIAGSVEPDRYVIMSNHRDAWVNGAIDPSSGTSQMMETARILGLKKRMGWRPRRTIIFCSFGSEEFSMIGSDEWVTDKMESLRSRTVGLLNVDVCSVGPILTASATPSVKDVIYDSLKYVSDPTINLTQYTEVHKSMPVNGTYLDFWTAWHRKYDGKSTEKEEEGLKLPEVFMPLAISDHVPFIFKAGVPIIHFFYNMDKHMYPNVSLYPLYHTAYDSFDLVEKIVDPKFEIHKSCTETSLQILLNMTESIILPHDHRHTSEVMVKAMAHFNSDSSTNITNKLDKLGIDTKPFYSMIKTFDETVNKFMRRIDDLRVYEGDLNPLEVRIMNDQLMGVDPIFIMPNGLPVRTDGLKHAVYSPPVFYEASSSCFPGITDLLYLIENNGEISKNEMERIKEELKKHISDLMIIVKKANDFLKPVHLV